MPLQSRGDAAVAVVLADPAELLGICMEDVNVRELVGECGDDSTTGVSLLQCQEQ